MNKQFVNSRRKHDVTCLVTPDFVGLGLLIDNNFQPIISFVPKAMLDIEIVVGVTFLGYGEKFMTCSSLSHRQCMNVQFMIKQFMNIIIDSCPNPWSHKTFMRWLIAMINNSWCSSWSTIHDVHHDRQFMMFIMIDNSWCSSWSTIHDVHCDQQFMMFIMINNS